MPLEPSRHRSRLPEVLLGAYLLALVYGSLYPWTGWRTGGPDLAFLFEPWPRYWTGFDVWVNVLVYLPLGTLAGALLQRRLGPAASAAGALGLAAAISLTLETVQTLVPGRVPSRMDWIANGAGALTGATLAILLSRTRAWRSQHWHRPSLPGADAGVGLALLATWIAIQMHPQRLLFGSGDVVEPLLGSAASLLAQVGLPEEAPGPLPGTDLLRWLATAVRAGPEYAVQIEALGTAAAVVAIGMIVREMWPAESPRVLITGALVAAAIVVRTISAALLLGGGQALAWLSAGAQGGLVTGAVALAMLSSGQRRWRLRVALGALALTVLLTGIFPPDAYHDSMIRVWNQGAWRNFNGLLRALAMLWPFAAAIWCAARLKGLNRAGPL